MTDDPRKWVQTADDLRAKMDAGELKPDARVSARHESQARGVHRATVARALQALAAEGRLRRYPGHGYVVVGWCPACQYQYASDAHKRACGTPGAAGRQPFTRRAC
jgi:DNA-binding GntR family transcriptional regulator